MKSRVNLLTEEYRPRLELVSFNLLMFCLVLSLSLLAASYFLVNVSAQQTSHVLAQTQSQQAARDNKISQLSEQLANQQPSAKLLAQIEQVENAIRQKRQLMRQLAGRDIQKSRGFSELMLALSRQDAPALWLTKIGLNEQHVHFEGQAVEASAVPRWIKDLGQSDYFAQTQFASARLYRDEQRLINFSLSSEPADKIGNPDEN